MADISEVKLPNNSTYDIKDKTARSAINDAVTMTFATVATTGSYDDLGNKPTIPTVPTISTDISADANSDIKTASPKAVKSYVDGSVLWEDNGTAGGATLKGNNCSLSGDYAIAEGYYTTAGADCAHAEGDGTVATGYASHAEGSGLTEEEAYDFDASQEPKPAPAATAKAAHAEGINTIASDMGAHAEGIDSSATSVATHAEGTSSATESYSHSEGYGSSASGEASHSEGYSTSSSGWASHTEGYFTTAQNRGEHASGNFNSSHKTNTTFGNAGNTNFSIGIGTSNNARSNAIEVMQNGDMYVKGVGSYTGAYASSGIKSLQTVLSEKQATLVSGTNIKTINNESILGSGNITISGGVTDVKLSDGTSVVSSGIANLPIPSVSSTDNGKVFGVDSGVWSLITPSTGVTDVTVGGTSVVSSGVAAIPAIPTVPTISTNVVSDKVSDTKTSSPKSVYSEIHPTKGTSQPSGGMLPNVWYDLGTLSSNTTFSVASPSDSDITNHYYWTFDTGSSAPTITWPNAITSWYGGTAPTINASTHYEVSLLDGVAICMEV